ncbi:MAG: gliding motility-associated C-terminal domain-containing protein [Saprospiraceae bacterium]|nr:gliding motility-associated C-terminal domain-containing protein [Saprospiraceae bacterium]
MRSFFLIALFVIPLSLLAQPVAGLIAYYDFDSDDGSVVDQTGTIANYGITTIDSYDCGVEDLAIRFNGINETVTIEGSEVISRFETEDVTISFYFKSLNTQQVQTQTIMSKRADCGNTNAFAIRYTPASSFLNVIFTENAGLSGSISAKLNPDHCWHHIVLVREGRDLSLIADGILIAQSTTPVRVDLTNPSIPLTLGASSCQITDGLFEGFMDELRIYDRALEGLEIESLYIRPDQIANGFINVDIPKDTTIYLGNTVQANITSTCNDELFWYPDQGINNAFIPDPVLEPGITTTYFLETTDLFGCTSLDSFRINVIDPSQLDCVAFLPNAFTPNDDGLNDLFGIDNPFALPDFTSLEIFDRWGNRVFYTEDPFIRWDGYYRSTAVNPDIYIYKVIYKCEGQEEAQTGSVKIIR